MEIIVICLLTESISWLINWVEQFSLESISNGFCATESREVLLRRNKNNFMVDYNFINKLSILDIHKNLMLKNIMK